MLMIIKSIKEKKTFSIRLNFTFFLFVWLIFLIVKWSEIKISSFVNFFLLFIIYNTHKFHIFNVFFYFDTYILKNEGKKKRKASFMSGVSLCASPFSQVTRLKVKKSDKFNIPSTFCDYLKRKREKTAWNVFPADRQTISFLKPYHFRTMLMKLIP